MIFVRRYTCILPTICLYNIDRRQASLRVVQILSVEISGENLLHHHVPPLTKKQRSLINFVSIWSWLNNKNKC